MPPIILDVISEGCSPNIFPFWRAQQMPLDTDAAFAPALEQVVTACLIKRLQQGTRVERSTAAFLQIFEKKILNFDNFI